MTVKIDTDAEINSIRVKEVSPPATPASGYGQLYAKTDGKLYFKNDAGLEIDLTLTGTAGNAYTQGARVYNSGNLTISNDAITVLTFNSERYDTDGIHSGTSSQLFCNTAGKYIISGAIQFAADADGYRLVAIKLNNTSYIAIDNRPAVAAGVETYITISTQYDLTSGDYVELWVQHTAGGDLAVVAAGNFSPEFMMQRIG